MIRSAILTTTLLLVTPVAAHAAGTTTLTVSGPAATSLREQGVRTIAIPPAQATRTTLTFPISSAGATTRHLGGFIFQAKRGGATRRLVLTSVQLRAVAGQQVLTALLAGRRVTLLRVASPRLGVASLGPDVAATIRRRLLLRHTPRGRFGTLNSKTPAPSGPTAPAPQPLATGTTTAPLTLTPTPTPPSVPGDPTPRTCAAPGTPPASEPSRPARPSSAVSVHAAAIVWHVRDSFTDYINVGEGTVTADGATAAPASGTPPLAREFSFPLRDGWFDAASGMAALRFSGCVRFSYSGHGIQIDAQDPEIELAEGHSRAVFRFSGSSTTAGRAVLVNLALAPPAISDDGHTRTWTELAGNIPTGAATSVFAGFYFPGDPFGWISVSLAT